MKKIKLDTKDLDRIENRLATLAKQAYKICDDLSTAIYRIEKNHKNIVAAHKAHTTMAKRDKGISPQRAQRRIEHTAYGLRSDGSVGRK